jgi:hypothetical protein
VGGIERTEERNESINDRLPAVQDRKIELKFAPGGPEIEYAIFHESRSQRIRIPVVESESVTMQSVRNLISVASLL